MLCIREEDEEEEEEEEEEEKNNDATTVKDRYVYFTKKLYRGKLSGKKVLRKTIAAMHEPLRKTCLWKFAKLGHHEKKYHQGRIE